MYSFRNLVLSILGTQAGYDPIWFPLDLYINEKFYEPNNFTKKISHRNPKFSLNQRWPLDPIQKVMGTEWGHVYFRSQQRLKMSFFILEIWGCGKTRILKNNVFWSQLTSKINFFEGLCLQKSKG